MRLSALIFAVVLVASCATALAARAGIDALYHADEVQARADLHLRVGEVVRVLAPSATGSEPAGEPVRQAADRLLVDLDQLHQGVRPRGTFLGADDASLLAWSRDVEKDAALLAQVAADPKTPPSRAVALGVSLATLTTSPATDPAGLTLQRAEAAWRRAYLADLRPVVDGTVSQTRALDAWRRSEMPAFVTAGRWAEAAARVADTRGSLDRLAARADELPVPPAQAPLAQRTKGLLATADAHAAALAEPLEARAWTSAAARRADERRVAFEASAAEARTALDSAFESARP